MLLLVTREGKKGGFIRRMRAEKGKIPPTVTGVPLGGYMGVRLGVTGGAAAHGIALQPYRDRGDVTVFARPPLYEEGINQPLILEYARRQCVNACVERLKKAPYTRVALVDHAGECVGVAAELAAVCSSVTVITDQPERFAPCDGYTRLTYGVGLMFSDRVPSCDLLLAPYGAPPDTGVFTAAPDGDWFPAEQDLFVPEYCRRTDGEFDPLAVTAGLFAAFHPPLLMEALPKNHEKAGQNL